MNERLRDLLHAVFPPRERASKDKRLAASDARAPKLLLALTVIAVLLPVGSGVGNGVGTRLTGAVCSGTGCDQPVSLLPTCEAVGRDRLMAGQMLAFSTTSIDGALRASTYGDGQVEVAVDDPQQQDSVLLYGFPDSVAAQHWLLAGSSTTTAAIDAGAGPAPVGVADGYRGAAGIIGLIGDAEREPRASVQRSGPPGGVLGGLEERDTLSGTTREVTVLDLGTEAGSSPQPEAARFAAEMGLTGLMSVSVRGRRPPCPWGRSSWAPPSSRASALTRRSSWTTTSEEPGSGNRDLRSRFGEGRAAGSRDGCVYPSLEPPGRLSGIDTRPSKELPHRTAVSLSPGSSNSAGRSTVTESPSWTSPDRICLARRSPISRCTSLRRGRAPYAGS